MKTVGIIGGLGPETTANFYLEVILSCFKTNKINRPPMLIFNVPMLFNLEEGLIKNGIGKENFLPFLINAAKHLERGGANFIVIPCNTAHIFIEEIRESVNIPVLSIIEETSNFLGKEKIKEIGLLATIATINNKLFDKNLKLSGIKIKTPGNSSQLKMGTIINRLVNNKHSEKDKKELLEIINELKVKNVILACTDLQILNPKCSGVKIFDTMDILAKATILEILK